MLPSLWLALTSLICASQRPTEAFDRHGPRPLRDEGSLYQLGARSGSRRSEMPTGAASNVSVLGEGECQMVSRVLIVAGSLLTVLNTDVQAAGGSIAGPTDARTVCRAYASKAVSQYWYAVYNCSTRLHDARWQPNFKKHYDWCMSGSNRGQPASRETAERYWILDKCKPGSGGPVEAP
jgi:hypothetical protein